MLQSGNEGQPDALPQHDALRGIHVAGHCVLLGYGLDPGLARLRVTNDAGVAIEQTGLDLHVYLDMHYHLTPGFTLAIDGGIDLQNLDETNKMALGESGESVSYLAIDLLPRVVRTLGDKTQVWIGAGYAFGGVGSLAAWRGNGARPGRSW